MREPIPWWFHVIAVLLSFAAGAWLMWKEQRPKVEPYAPAIVQADGSRILERNPDKPRPALPQIPKGSKVIRVTTAEIRGTPPPTDGGVPPSVETVQFTEIQAQDGGTRVIASAEGGRIIGGSDWTGPVLPAPRVFHWEAQAIRAFTPRGAAWGASLGYGRGPFVASMAVVPGAGGSIQIGLGVRW